MTFTNNFQKSFYFLLCTAVTVLVLLIIIGKIWTSEHFIYPVWADRNLIRSSELLTNFTVHGAEWSGSFHRTPGAAMYYINYLLLQINDSPHFIYLVYLLAQFLGVILLYDIGRRTFGHPAGLLVAFAQPLSPWPMSGSSC